MNAKFHVCLLLIILGTLTVQGAATKNLAKRGATYCDWQVRATCWLKTDPCPPCYYDCRNVYFCNSSTNKCCCRRSVC
ncbi:small cysteine-rich protein 5-like [Oculina patagonica]